MGREVQSSGLQSASGARIFPSQKCEGLLAVDAALAARLDAAAVGPKPAEALRALARALKARGMPQNTIYGLFFECFYHHQDHAEDQRLDAIAQVLDLIRQQFGEL